MKPTKKLIVVFQAFALLLIVTGCGEEYYATPEKTLERYVNSRKMSRREEYESCLNSFRKEDREWWDANWEKICVATMGQDCPGESVAAEAATWELEFEPAGPEVVEVESSTINDDEAVVVVRGQEIDFVKERGNWKIKGFFGVPEDLEQRYPNIHLAALN